MKRQLISLSTAARIVVASTKGRGLHVAGLLVLTTAVIAISAAVSRRSAAGHSGTVVWDVVYTDRGGHVERLDLYLPSGVAPPGGFPVILAFPGGGWRWADRKSYGRAVAAAFTKNGFAVAGAEYAFAGPRPPSRSWPLNFEDARDSVRWVRRNARKFGLNPDKIVAMGESAGAHLAALLATYPDGPVPLDDLPTPVSPGESGETSARVRAAVSFYGPTDLERQYRECPKVRLHLHTFLGGSPDEHPTRYAAASPLTHVSSDDPPILIYQGGKDPTVLPNQATSFAEALAKAGTPNKLVLFDKVGHGFRYEFRGHSIVPDIVEFLNGALESRSRPGHPPAGLASHTSGAARGWIDPPGSGIAGGDHVGRSQSPPPQ